MRNAPCGFKLHNLENREQRTSPRNLLVKCLKHSDSVHIGISVSRTVTREILESRTIKLEIKPFPDSRRGRTLVIKKVIK